MKRLDEILDLGPSEAGVAERPIGGLTADSRKVRPGDAFFALAGAKQDGLAFVADALAKGAAVVVGERAPAGGAPFVKVADARAALAKAAARFYSRQPECIVAVTGTSGKTSVAAFARQIWAAAGREAASLGTLGVVSRPLEIYGSLTTPDTIALHQTLDKLAGVGVTHLALEASSHGLDQKRLDGVRLAAGAFTNLSRDHLDYHETKEAYLDAKLRLFRELLPNGAPAVIDGDSDVAPRVIEAARARSVALCRWAARRRAAVDRRRARRLLVAHRRRTLRSRTSTAVAAAGRLPGLQRFGRRRPVPRDGNRPRDSVRRIGAARRRAGSARARRR